jgi:hypothetical protein
MGIISDSFPNYPETLKKLVLMCSEGLVGLYL